MRLFAVKPPLAAVSWLNEESCIESARRAGLPTLRLDSLNQRLLDAVNGTGEFFLSHTKLDDRLTLRVAIGNIRTTQAHIDRLWAVLAGNAERLSKDSLTRT